MDTITATTGDRVLYEFPKSKAEVVRARLKRLSGRIFCDLRVYYAAETDGPDEDYLPSKKGLCLRVDQLPELRRAIDALEEAARAA